jgi:glycosyltransferase involved in cell wall biosynthesis
MEHTLTHHLKRIGAYCSHELKSVPEDSGTYPVKASVIMPVRNREKTVADAIRSAVNQKTDSPFNVLVVQNHSTDNTREEIEKVAKHNSRVIQIIPGRKDLRIGGCWNLAVQSTHCGQYVCQLDSDDLYEGEDALNKMIETLQRSNCGMTVGTYRVVNRNLEEIPPGVVDHREWSKENGRNNLLRVHGIGAPRGFPTVLLKQYPFPNVSYGEDYAVALRISRDFHVSRIFTPLYLCRRWEENTDSNLSKLEENKFAYYKDQLRTQEILERQKLNQVFNS